MMLEKQLMTTDCLRPRPNGTTLPRHPEENEDPPFLERTPVQHLENGRQTAPQKAQKKYKNAVSRILAPKEDDVEVTIPTLDPHTLRAITKIRFPEYFQQGTKEDPLEEAEISSDIIEHMIHAIQSKATTPE